MSPTGPVLTPTPLSAWDEVPVDSHLPPMEESPCHTSVTDRVGPTFRGGGMELNVVETLRRDLGLVGYHSRLR